MDRTETARLRATAAASSPGDLVSEPNTLNESLIGPLQGTPIRVEWAEQIRAKVGAEFDRVAATFRSVANNQAQQKREFTETVLLILEDKRAEVMAMRSAGYFIQSWQEITDQVRQMIFHDERYQAMKTERESRQSPRQ